MHSFIYSTKEFELDRPLIVFVLYYGDQQAPSVIGDMFLHALMVQAEPKGPTDSAHHRSEGIDSRDTEPRVQGQDVHRENENEKGYGMGGASADQP